MYRQMSVTRQTGLTLLELVVSLLVMTILTSVAITSVSGIQEQARYEKTLNQLDEIREAIIGRRTPLRSYVFDLATVPPYLHALLEREFCTDPAYTDQTSCNTASATWVSHPTWTLGPVTYYSRAGDTSSLTTSYLGYGWNGPYLQVTGSASNPDVLRDAWGGKSGSDTDTNDYGWQLTFATTTLTVESFGEDQTDGTNACGKTYQEDCLASIGYKTNPLIGITVQIAPPNTTPPTTQTIRVVVASKKSDGSGIELRLSDCRSITQNGTPQTQFFNLPANTRLAAGRVLFGVLRSPATCSPIVSPLANATIYPDNKRMIEVDLFPHSDFPIIYW